MEGRRKMPRFSAWALGKGRGHRTLERTGMACRWENHGAIAWMRAARKRGPWTDSWFLASLTGWKNDTFYWGRMWERRGRQEVGGTSVWTLN